MNIALNNDLKLPNVWMQDNKLSLNVAKTKPLLIGKKPRHNNLSSADMELSLNICGSELEVVEKIKYLRVQVDNSFDWMEHIKVVSSKVSKALRLLKYARRSPSITSLKTLYLSIVEPHHRYCCSVWGYCGSTTRSWLQRIQNRAARIVTNCDPDTQGSFLIKSLGWKTIDELI